jgi:hypothetical protein
VRLRPAHRFRELSSWRCNANSLCLGVFTGTHALRAEARHRARALQKSRHEAEITCTRCLNKIAKLNLCYTCVRFLFFNLAGWRAAEARASRKGEGRRAKRPRG